MRTTTFFESAKSAKSALIVAILGLTAARCGGAATGPGGTGGSSPPSGGTGGAIGGASPTGGTPGGGPSGGAGGSGGSVGSGGSPGSGGSATGGAPGSGGSPASGGASGGAPSTGGAGQTGGAGGRAGTGGARAGGASGAAGQPSAERITFGTTLDPQAVMASARQVAAAQAMPGAAQWRAKGDQKRTYRFAEANTTAPFRLYVPTNWDGQSQLPLVMFLHGAGADENTYIDQNNKQVITLAQQHGYLLVAPLGDQGAYGNFLRLSAPFGKPEEAAKLIAAVTPESERTNELSEKDVINVLELILAEYPIDRAAMFLTGHSMGSGGTWYIGGKYAGYWRGLAPMSGPFVQETGYPWANLRPIYIRVTEGTQAPSLQGSHALRDWLAKNAFMSEYEEVNADHPGMVRLVLPGVFDFFDRSRPH